jgi:hypothetical protein
VTLQLFALGSHLAELITDLKLPNEDRESVERLHRDFGNLREVVQSSDMATREALLDPVLDRFHETLGAIAAAHSHLEPKCADLQRRLRCLLASPPLSPPDLDDESLPF